MLLDNLVLKKSIQPYIGFTVIFSFITILVIVTALRTEDWNIVYAMLLGWLVFYLPFVYIGLRYRIILRDGEIIQKAFRGKDVVINTTEITHIQRETSDLLTLLSFRRPLRRIAIYAQNPQHLQSGKFIDVSLKHFMPADIRKLMQEIHNRRPDLEMPKIQ